MRFIYVGRSERSIVSIVKRFGRELSGNQDGFPWPARARATQVNGFLAGYGNPLQGDYGTDLTAFSVVLRAINLSAH